MNIVIHKKNQEKTIMKNIEQINDFDHYMCFVSKEQHIIYEHKSKIIKVEISIDKNLKSKLFKKEKQNESNNEDITCI